MSVLHESNVPYRLFVVPALIPLSSHFLCRLSCLGTSSFFTAFALPYLSFLCIRLLTHTLYFPCVPFIPVLFPLFPVAFPSSSSFVPAFSFPFSPLFSSPSSSIYKKSSLLNRAWFRVLNICFTAYSLFICGSFSKFAGVYAWKKVVIIFGSYGKRLYLCTRFREARPCEAVRNGAEERRVHWKSYIKRESSTRAWMFFWGGGIVLLRGHPRVKKKRTVMIPVYAGHIRGMKRNEING